MTKTQQPLKLYACCSNPESKTYQEIVFLLRMWDFQPEPIKEGRQVVFNVQVPAYWGRERRKTFSEALAGLPATHQRPPRRPVAG